MTTTTYQLNRLAKWEFGLATPTPTNFWVGLSRAPINKDGTGADEPSSSAGYARKEIPLGATGWSSPLSDGTVISASAVTFQSTATWDTIVSVFLADSSTIGGGNILHYYDLKPSIPVIGSTTIQFSAKTLVIKNT